MALSLRQIAFLIMNSLIGFSLIPSLSCFIKKSRSVKIPLKIKFSKLSKKDALEVKVTEIRDNWETNNSTGITTVHAGKLDDKVSLDNLDNIAKENFNSQLSEYFEDATSPKTFKVKSGSYSEKIDLADTVEALALGNAFDPKNKDDRKQLKEDLEAMIGMLGRPKDILTLKASVKVKDDNDEDRKVFAIVFLNKLTRKAIRIFVKEGTI